MILDAHPALLSGKTLPIDKTYEKQILRSMRAALVFFSQMAEQLYDI